MSDILFAKEVYVHNRNKNQQSETVHEMRAVSGLYITGVWRPPHYIGQHLFITDIGGNKATVYSYTEREINIRPANYVTGITKFNKKLDLNIVKYSQLTKHSRPGNYTTGISKFANSNSLYVRKYSTDETNVRPANYVSGISKFHCISNLEIRDISYEIYDNGSTGKPTLKITAIGGNKATITNSNS